MAGPIPIHIQAQLIAGRVDTFAREFDRIRAAETEPEICEKLDDLRTLTSELIGLYHDRIPVVPPPSLPDTGHHMRERRPGHLPLSHGLVKKR